MSRKTVLRGLLDLPLDWLLLPYAGVLALVEWQARLPGQRLTRVRGVVTHVSGVPLSEEIVRRLALGVWVTLFFLVVPLFVRRSARRWRGQRTRNEDTFFDMPFHWDPIWWLMYLWLAAVSTGPLRTELFVHDSVAGIGIPFTEHVVVKGEPAFAWLAVLVIGTLGAYIVAALLTLGRRVYRRLGDPTAYRLPRWQRAFPRPLPASTQNLHGDSTQPPQASH